MSAKIGKLDETAILQAVQQKWNYDRSHYWLPLVASNFTVGFDYLFIMEDKLQKYDEQIIKLLFCVHPSIYYIPLQQIDRRMYRFSKDEFLKNRNIASEYFCTPSDYSWVYYRSHEHTVTFAGSILKPIIKFLDPEKAYWNVYAGG